MSRKLLFFGMIFLLLAAAAVTPISVRAEDDPPPTPQPVKPPWITGKNPHVVLSTTEERELTPSGLVESWEGVELPLLAEPPAYVELEPQFGGAAGAQVASLAVPQRYQDPLDQTCGAAALGMALEFLSRNGEGQAPSQETLVRDLKEAGLLYETGTGVEELAFLARQHGYQGASAFHDWTFDQLRDQLAAGKPVVVSLGANGMDQPGHFVTLTGISEDGKWVSYNDPLLGKQTQGAADFQKLWALGGNSGLLAQQEPLSAQSDPMLPWMGLFGAMAMLAVMAKQYPLSDEFTGILSNIRSALADPRRKGLGGALIAEGGSSSAPPYIAPPGYSWKKNVLPVYGWKDVTITEKVEVPNLIRTWAIVKVNRWIEKVPVYKTVKVDKGHWAYCTVTKYRTESYRTTERYKTTKYYWYRKNGRLVRGSYDVWKTRTVVKTRKVPYTVREKYWVPKIVEEQSIDHYREIEHRDPVYGWREEKHGTKIIEQTKTTRAWAQVGTEVKWELKKDPVPTPPKSTPTVTYNPTPPGLTLTPTPPPTENLEDTPYPTATPSPSNIPIAQYNWPSTGTSTPIPDSNQAADVQSQDDTLEYLEPMVVTAKDQKKVISFIYSNFARLIAASKINITEIDDTLRIFGPRAARSTLKLNPYTNWTKPTNLSGAFQTIDDAAVSSLSSKSSQAFIGIGLGLNIASNSIDLAQGDVDRFEYAAAMTVDTGLTIGAVMLSGAVMGAVAGGLVSAGFGAPIGAIIGGLAGAIVAISASELINGTGARDYVVDSVADMYQDWVEGE